MNKAKKILACFLILALLITAGPTAGLVSADQTPATYTLDNDYIRVVVSNDDGGFYIQTSQGDKLNKEDNDKDLLYHSGDYDTSFTSFEVTDDSGNIKEYVFGGNYSFLGLGGNNLAVTRDATGISAVWSVAGLTFTQRIELANTGSSEHGMVYLSYSMVNNSGKNVKVKARVLLDTALGGQDYAYYEVIDKSNTYRRIQNETVLTTADSIPANFFGYDNLDNPAITSYTVNNAESMPYQVAFGHWNNLASTCFNFTPDASLTFTNEYNQTYQTADSAYALYYDLGAVAPAGGEAKLSTYYGVYSNEAVSVKDRVSVNVTAPSALELNADKTQYVSTCPGKPEGTFSIQTQVNNLAQTSAKNYDSVAVALYTSNGVTPLDSFGNDLGYTVGYTNPYQIKYQNFTVGQTQTTQFYFKADVDADATYRKIEIKVFSLPDTAQGKLLQENLLGSTFIYVLCPGGNGNLPSILFTSADPPILYHEGTRHLFVTGKNFNLLQDKSAYSLWAYGADSGTTTGPGAQNSFQIPTDQISFPEENVMDIVFSESMPIGAYSLVFEWTNPPAGIDKSLTAPALQIVMTDDKAYKNDYYGIIAVVQLKNGSYNGHEYKIKSYATEAQFDADKANFQEVLLAFRGEFTAEQKGADGQPVYFSAVSDKATDNDGNVTVNNLITVNNCIDFENGSLNIYYDGIGVNQKICVDFDGDLYTSQERSTIWSGYAAFTEIKNNYEYSLVPYNSSGEKLTGFSDMTISLIWPSGLGVAQTIGGMVFNLAYGVMGIMYGNDENGGWPSKITDLSAKYPIDGCVLSFSAALDLSFLIPSRSKTQEEKNWDAANEWLNMSDQNGTLLRNRWAGLDFEGKVLGDTSDAKEEKEEKTLKVMVDDILYGCGDGYIGFNCNIEVALPGYIEAMPTMKGKLSINTIGGWSLGVEGSMKFTTIEMEFDIGLVSYEGYPIPDKLYFYISGFEPGINVDGFGVLWITGGGGGFSDLYKTIFVSSGIPPLKLMLSVSFDILKVLSARTDLGISLRGLSIKASDVKIKATDLTVIDRALLSFEWYPDFNFVAAVTANILGIVTGSGYIVVVNNETYHGFVEFFLRATLGIPDYIPFVGGMKIGGVDLGANNEKIWGVLTALGLKLGVTYYWGGSFDYGTKGTASPTFPDLLSIVDDGGKTGIGSDVPVYTDTTTGDTLYMRIGNNVHVAATAQVMENIYDVGSSSDIALLGSASATVKSDLEKKNHVLNLGSYVGKASAFTINYDAASLTEAQNLAAQITIKNKTATPAEDYALTLYDPILENNTTANSNLTYDSATSRATLSVTMTAADDFDKNWTIVTPTAADITLYAIDNLPSVDSVSVSTASAQTGSPVTLSYSGSQLNELESVSFYLTDDNGQGTELTDSGTFLGSVDYTELSSLTTSGSKTIILPKDLASGTYYVRAVYRSPGLVNASVTSGTTLTVTNADQPAVLSSVQIVNSGDLTLKADFIDSNLGLDVNGGAACDGYILNVYQYDAAKNTYTLTDVNNLTRDKVKDAHGNLVRPDLTIGGSYTTMKLNAANQYEPVVCGLEAGQSYRVGITPYNHVYSLDGQTLLYTAAGEESYSNTLVLKAATPPTIICENETAFKTIQRSEWGKDAQNNPVMVTNGYDTFQSGTVNLRLNANTPVSGTWVLDGGAVSGQATQSSSVPVQLTALAEGDHTLTFSGTDGDGDSFLFTKIFSVDTIPPNLLLSSPVNGSFFAENGDLTITGVGDPDALYTILSDGTAIAERKTLAELGGAQTPDGVFSMTVNLGTDKAYHKVTITAADPMGNAVQAEATVKNMGLSAIAGIGIYKSANLSGSGDMGWTRYSNQNIKLEKNQDTRLVLALMATTQSGHTFILNGTDAVDWTVFAASGSAGRDMDGLLTVSAGSYGYVAARYLVAVDASLSDAVTFGAERFLEDQKIPLDESGQQNTGDITKTYEAYLQSPATYLILLLLMAAAIVTRRHVKRKLKRAGAAAGSKDESDSADEK